MRSAQDPHEAEATRMYKGISVSDFPVACLLPSPPQTPWDGWAPRSLPYPHWTWSTRDRSPTPTQTENIACSVSPSPFLQSTSGGSGWRKEPRTSAHHAWAQEHSVAGPLQGGAAGPCVLTAHAGIAGTEPLPQRPAQTKKPPCPKSLMMSDHSARQASY